MLSRLKASSGRLGVFLGSCETHSRNSLARSVGVVLCQKGVEHSIVPTLKLNEFDKISDLFELFFVEFVKFFF